MRNTMNDCKCRWKCKYRKIIPQAMADVFNIHAYWVKCIEAVNPLELYLFPNFLADKRLLPYHRWYRENNVYKNGVTYRIKFPLVSCLAIWKRVVLLTILAHISWVEWTVLKCWPLFRNISLRRFLSCLGVKFQFYGRQFCLSYDFLKAPQTN